MEVFFYCPTNGRLWDFFFIQKITTNFYSAPEKASCEKMFEETASGANTDRPVLAEAIDYCREGDVLVVWKLDRLGRSLKDLIEKVWLLQEKGVWLKILQENMDTTTTGGKLVFHIF